MKGIKFNIKKPDDDSLTETGEVLKRIKADPILKKKIVYDLV